MKHKQIEQCGDWQIATARGINSWIAWGKMGVLANVDPIKELGKHVWFQIGKSREEASYRLKRELGLL